MLDIYESLCFLFSFFQKNVECETPEKSFRWSIGQMADFHPVIIDETQSVCQTPLVLIRFAFQIISFLRWIKNSTTAFFSEIRLKKPKLIMLLTNFGHPKNMCYHLLTLYVLFMVNTGRSLFCIFATVTMHDDSWHQISSHLMCTESL